METAVVEFDKFSFLSNEQAIFHVPEKFVIDFKNMFPQLSPNGEQMMVATHRVILLDPPTAKSFLECLQQNIKNYEKQFGQIKTNMKVTDLTPNKTQVDSPSYMG